MNVYTKIANVIEIVLICFCLFLLFRNSWVCRVRVNMIYNDHDKYEELPSYDAMLWRFWIWDVNKFLPKKTSNPCSE